MHTFQMRGPGGDLMTTTAPSLAKAWNNLRYRLVREYGLTWWDARNFDHSDLEMVD